jgi:nicotinamidase/pyrazinamidase
MKHALIVVDFQVDFVSGSLGFPEAHRLDPIIATKIQAYHERCDDIYFTIDTHDDSYPTTSEGVRLPILHCVKGTPGHQLYNAVGNLSHLAVKHFEKTTFPSLDLANHLKNCAYDEVELCGLVSHICVLANAVMVKSALPNARIVVDVTATASYDSKLHEQALAIMRGLHIDVVGGH